MVSIAFSTLSTRVRANYGIIRAGVERWLKEPAIQELVRATGQRGRRKQEILKGMGFAGTGVQQASTMRFTRKDRRPNYDTFRSFVPRTSPKKYLIDYKVEWRDPSTGALGESYITVGTDERLTMAQLDQAAADAWDLGQRERRYAGNLEVLSFPDGRPRIISGVPRQRV